MTAIMTGAKGILAYHNAKPLENDITAFGLKGDFHRPLDCAFASLSAFSANSNHAPADHGELPSWDAGVDLLFRIAGAR